MELILCNLSAPERVIEGGREFLVAPLTLIVPGVLNGSQGALYYPPEEIQRNTDAWNGVPITLRHPRIKGNLVSAKDGGVMLGTIRNARYEDKLVADGWFDVANLREQDPQLLQSVESGDERELSTGLFTDNKPVKNGNHEGTPYTHVATNHQPDHLAILPDEKGACSVSDGCGVNINQADSLLFGTTGETGGHTHYVEVDEDGYGWTRIEHGHGHEVDHFKVLPQIHPEQSADGHTHSLDRQSLMEKGLGANSVLQKLSALYYETANAITELFAGNAQPHSKNTGKFKRSGSGTGKGEAHSRAQAAYAEASITDRHKSLGMTAKGQTEAGNNPVSWVGDEGTWEKAKQSAEKSGQGDNYALITYIYENMGGTILSGNERHSNDEEGDMPLTKAQKKVLVDNLLDCCWEEEDRETLEGLTDNQLTRLTKEDVEKRELTLVANAARETFKLPKDMKLNAIPEEFKKAAAAKDEGDDEEKDDEGKKEKTENEGKPMTEEQWLAQAPQAVRNRLDFADDLMKQQRREAIAAVTANIQGEEKVRVEKNLELLTLNQIRDFVALTPAPVRRTDNYGTIPPVDNQGEKEPTMAVRTWDFSPAAK